MNNKMLFPFLRFFPVIMGIILLLSVAAPAQSSVIDAPHNENGGVKCGDCHRYSLWWTYSPARNSTTPYNQITDGICASCHSEPGFPNKISHAASSMIVIHNEDTGDWSTTCIDCHDPHHQTQLGWLETIPPATEPEITEDDIYLVMGQIDSDPSKIKYYPASNTTEIVYHSTAADDTWLTPADWSAKTAEDRGLILVVSRTNRDDTFEINSATGDPITSGSADGAGTIIVQGNLNTSHAGQNFGIVYGQLVKQFIQTTHSSQERPVKFFNARTRDYYNQVGGFVEMVNGTPQGICQVCHTKTDYWLEDGSLIHPTRFIGVENAPTDHNDDISLVPDLPKCTGCHMTSDGFQPLNADHTFITKNGTTCSLCHDGADIVADTHKSHCTSTCHSAVPLLKTPFPSPKWPTPAAAQRDTGNCYDCHSEIKDAFAAHPNALDHSTKNQVAGSPNCTTSCHFHYYKDFSTGALKDIITDIHAYESADRQLESLPEPATPCDTCHNLEYNSLTGAYSGNGVLVSPAVPGPADCTVCHSGIAEDITSHPNRGSHSGQIIAKAECVRCHSPYSPSPTAKDPMVDNIHNNMCGYCHMGTTYALQNSALNGPGDCVNCHTDFTLIHTASGPTHATVVTSDPYCTNCHNQSDMVSDIHVTDGCATCHNSLGQLKSLAANHGKNDAEFGDPNTCSTCHTDKGPGSNHPSHAELGLVGALDKILPVNSCVSCHMGDDIAVVHNDTCINCHAEEKHYTLKAGVPMAGGTCADCHSLLGVSFWDHQKAYDHVGQVDTVAGCASCHNGNAVLGNHYPAGGCNACHGETGTLQGSAIPQASGKPPADKPQEDQSINCMSCHGVFTDPPKHSDPNTVSLDHSFEVQNTPNCTARCHTEADLVNGIHNTLGCRTCHNDDGSLAGSAIPFGGTCLECHTDFSLHSGLSIDLSHPTQIQMTNGCNTEGCHTETDLVNGLHDVQGCATCHASDGALNLPAVPLGGECAACHEISNYQTNHPPQP